MRKFIACVVVICSAVLLALTVQVQANDRDAELLDAAAAGDVSRVREHVRPGSRH